MRFIGIDPGKLGGVCVIPSEDRISGVTADKMPTNTFDMWQLFAGLEGDSDAWAVIEDVHSGLFHGRQQGVKSGRQQGVKSAFTFGQNYGHLIMALTAAGIPFERVRPRIWQKEFGLLKKPGETDSQKKNRHKARAQELCPALRMTHSIADAFLIAEFGRRIENSR